MLALLRSCACYRSSSCCSGISTRGVHRCETLLNVWLQCFQQRDNVQDLPSKLYQHSSWTWSGNYRHSSSSSDSGNSNPQRKQQPAVPLMHPLVCCRSRSTMPGDLLGKRGPRFGSSRNGRPRISGWQLAGCQAGFSSSCVTWSAAPQHSDDRASLTEQQQQQVEKEAEEEDRSCDPPPTLDLLSQRVFYSNQVLRYGRYKLQECINRVEPALNEDCITTLWRARDLVTQRELLLKCVEAGDAAAYAASLREPVLHATLGRCPNIAPLLDVFEHRSGSGRHTVMVLDPGGPSLTQVIKGYRSSAGKSSGAVVRGISDGPTIKKLAREILTALDHLHSNGLVYMDLHPDRVFLDAKRGQVPIFLDFAAWNLTTLRTSFSSPHTVIHFEDAQGLVNVLSFEQPRPPWQEVLAACQSPPDVVFSKDDLQGITFQLRDLEMARFPGSCRLPHSPPATDAHTMHPGMKELLQKPTGNATDDEAYKPPEEIWGTMGDCVRPTYDIWKYGCLLVEALAKQKLTFARVLRPLFHLQPDNQEVHPFDLIISAAKGPHVTPDERLAWLEVMEQDFGTPKPFSLRDAQQHAVAFNVNGLSDALENYWDPEDVSHFRSFLESVLAVEPSKRPSASELLQHPWLQAA